VELAAEPARLAAAVQCLDLAHVPLEWHAAPDESLGSGGGEKPAPDGRADAFPREIAGEPGGVSHQHEAWAGEAPGRAAAHHVGVAFEGLDRQGGGGRAVGAERGHERVAPSWQAAVVRARAADPDVEEILLGKVPGVAAKIRLDVELRGAHEAAQPLDPLGGEPRLALLRGHDLLALRD